MMKILIADDFELLREDLCDTLGAQAVSAALKALFNGAACARDLRARLGRDINQPFQRLAVGQEIVHQQEIVAGLNVILAHHDVVIRVVGVGMHHRRVQVTGKIAGFVFLSVDHRDVHGCSRRHRNGDAAGFDGENLRHLRVRKETRDFSPHLHQEVHVNLVVEKGPHLQNVARQHSALAQYFFFQCFHDRFSPNSRTFIADKRSFIRLN